MLSQELIVSGYIIVPDLYLDSFQSTISEMKGKNTYTDFADFITSPVQTSRYPITSFGYIYRYEEKDEIEIIKRFEILLKRVDFLSAIIQIEIEGKESLMFEYIFDGKNKHKFERILQKSNSSDPTTLI